VRVYASSHTLWLLKCAACVPCQPFVNYEPDLTGIGFWVDAVLGPGKPRETFFASWEVFNKWTE
jgi:hypothetical protein